MAEEHDSWLSNPAIGVSFGSVETPSAAKANEGNGAVPIMQKKVEAEFISQTGSTDCKKTANAMAKTAGVNPGPASLGIEMAQSADAKGHVTVDPKRAEEGRNYIDNQLASDKPVIVGVSHSEQGVDEKNTDKITDHYVLVTGRGTDENGRVFYTFKDPAGNKDKGDDTNPKNRFFVDESGRMVKAGNEGPTDENGERVGVIDRNYEVSLVVGNATLQGPVPASANAPENADIVAVRQALRKAGKSPAESGSWCKADSTALFEFQKEAGLLDKDGKPVETANGIVPVTPKGITPGDGTDRALLGGFKNKPEEAFSSPKPATTTATAPTAAPAKAESKKEEGGLADTLKGAARKLEEAAEGVAAKGKQLLEEAKGWGKEDKPASGSGGKTSPESWQPEGKTLALRETVGVKGKNDSADVIAVQEAFMFLGLYSPSSEQCDDSLIRAISDFQKRMKNVRVDGTIDPGGKTEQAINRALSAR
jgi:hypothetical protein